ncbi:MAG: patatin-like phospholipase family protein [Acidimicrobiia bacterium]
MPDEDHAVDLVFEGGGVKGIALAGALAVIEEQGYVVQRRAGASAGAIVAALHAAGYTGAELSELVPAIDFAAFRDRGWEDRIPLAGSAISILKDKGIYEGTAFREWLAGLLADRGVVTFDDLRTDEAGDATPLTAHRLQIIVSDLTERRLLVLPADARKLGIEPSDLEVATAVRMSMAIPLYFEPVEFDNPDTGATHVLVDGGMLSNFPVWLFDVPGAPRWPTFGLDLVEAEPERSVGERLPVPEKSLADAGIVEYLKALVSTMVEAQDRRYLEEHSFARTIPLPTLGVSTTDFGLSEDRAVALLRSGRTAAERFLERWDFDAYVATYRTGADISRTTRVDEAMGTA